MYQLRNQSEALNLIAKAFPGVPGIEARISLF